MIVSFSKNPIKQLINIIWYNYLWLSFFIICATSAYLLHDVYEITWVKLPVVPISILGGALAIFLGFRNSSAYDRWWEARKIWGAVVNDSRTFVMQIQTYTASDGTKEDEEKLQKWKKKTIYRHIGWVYALASHLRKEKYCEELASWASEEDKLTLSNKTNVPAQIIAIQGLQIKHALENGWIEDFRQFELVTTLSKFYDDQGKAERIKNTVFPYYYNYFTRMFLRLFTFCLPFALVTQMDWAMIPVSTAISFVFSILEKTGMVTEVPFEGKAADTPLRTICRGIEIDLREMIEDDNIPKPLEITHGRFGVLYRE